MCLKRKEYHCFKMNRIYSGLCSIIKISLINYSPDFMFNHRKFSTSCSHMLVKKFICTFSNKVLVTYIHNLI